MDLGECTKIHDLALRADYEIASKERDLFFELDVSNISSDGKRNCSYGMLFIGKVVKPILETQPLIKHFIQSMLLLWRNVPSIK